MVPRECLLGKSSRQTQVHAALLVLSVGEMQSESTWEVRTMSCVEWEAYCQAYLRVLNALNLLWEVANCCQSPGWF